MAGVVVDGEDHAALARAGAARPVRPHRGHTPSALSYPRARRPRAVAVLADRALGRSPTGLPDLCPAASSASTSSS